MAHGKLDLVHSWQEQPRGDDKTFAAGMLMGMARRPIGDGTLAVQGDGQPRSADGQARLSAAAGQRRNGRRRRGAGRPAAPARFLHGAVGEHFAEHRPEEQCVPLRRPPRRARVRAAGLHASPVDQRIARSAHQPSLAGFDAYYVRRGDRRPGPRQCQDRTVAFQWPRTGPASLEHRDWPAGFDLGEAVVEPQLEPGSAGQLGAS